jgi:exodeoxyribonuclease VII small subunit
VTVDSELEFEAALGELERLVTDLERGEPALAEALAKYERGIRLVAHCHGLLDGAERTVAILAGVDRDGQPTTAPFDATATAEREQTQSPARNASASRRRSLSNTDDESIPF